MGQFPLDSTTHLFFPLGQKFNFALFYCDGSVTDAMKRAMANIRKRKDVKRPCWQVQLRRVGCPSFTITFLEEREAAEWARKNECAYMDNPAAYVAWIQKERLRLRREREGRVRDYGQGKDQAKAKSEEG